MMIDQMAAYPLVDAAARFDELIADQRPVLLTGRHPSVLLPWRKYAEVLSAVGVAEYLIEQERQRLEPLPSL